MQNFTPRFFFICSQDFFLLSWDKELDLNKRPGTKLRSCLTVYLYIVYHQGLNLKASRLDKNLCKTLSYLQCPWILQMFECGDFYKNNYLNGGNAYILDKSRLGFEWIYEKAWRAVLNREREKRERELCWVKLNYLRTRKQVNFSHTCISSLTTWDFFISSRRAIHIHTCHFIMIIYQDF